LFSLSPAGYHLSLSSSSSSSDSDLSLKETSLRALILLPDYRYITNKQCKVMPHRLLR
jgi:hypothetical protein